MPIVGQDSPSMSPDPEKPKKAPRKHVTTACVPCRESKIRCDGSTPHCQNCQRKGKECKYQHGDDKRKVSLRAATELFSARIDQLCQFIHDRGLEPPPMNPEDEAGMNRVLDTLQIPRGMPARTSIPVDEQGMTAEIKLPVASGTSPVQSPPTTASNNHGRAVAESTTRGSLQSQGQQLPSSVDPWNSLGMRAASDNQNFVHWGFTLPTAESLDTIYANLNGGPGMMVNTGLSPDSFQLGMDMAQQPGVLLGQLPHDRDQESESDEENEAESDVIEQLSHRIGTLKIAGDGHLRFYGATSNLNLVDVSATQQRQRPDARTVRYDGQDILNHLRVGQPVDQALEDHLVELYFTWQNPSIYVVDKEMYMTARSKWRTEFDDTPFYSEVLTNAMCAIGSAFEARYHPTFITFPKSLAEFFADRAKALLEIELDTPCVATVQALVLLSCHEGSSNRDARGWLYSGMSMRLAFDLGLHIDMTQYVSQGDISPHEADVRRAAFWGSYVADQQFVVLWDMISPVGHILYGCSDISRHDLQRLCFQVTEDLFAWKANLPSTLEIDLDDDMTPRLPHLLVLHMQYHQIIIFFHRPWVSKSYIQPRSPRQGPGYHHARRMCIASATAVARLLHLYEKHYTFRRMNNQVVAIIFSAALMLLFVTVSSSPVLPSKPGETTSTHSHNAEMAAYLNLCFRALDELGQSFENAKRTRDYLVTLQRRWQTHMRRSGSAAKRQMSSANLLSGVSQPSSTAAPPGRNAHTSNASRKKSRLSTSDTPPRPRHNSASMAAPAGNPPYQLSQPISPQQSQSVYQQQAFPVPSQPGELDWIRDTDLNLLSGNTHPGNDPNVLHSIPNPALPNDPGMLPDLGDMEGWWGSNV
ncbi:hypothetical protein N7512_005589 [Penicillium capsulatum]|nr:hypothetical protein N7512_005589 [Penicillium capsulatum]